MGKKRRNERRPKYLRKEIVSRTCETVIVRIKRRNCWHSGDWIYFEFMVKATGTYRINEAIFHTRQWQTTYSEGISPLYGETSHEFRAARLHAIKAIEQQRREFGDQSELF